VRHPDIQERASVFDQATTTFIDYTDALTA
jgi:hypothetical protein